jgi:serine protease Do
MGLRKYSGMGLVFILGVAVGGTLIRFSYHRTVGVTEAQKRALRVLDRPIPDSDIGDNRIVTAVKKIEPAVVNIDTIGRIRSNEFGSRVYADQEIRGKGSGVILTSDGYIVTNNHVIDGAKRIRVTLATGSWYYAHLVGVDTLNDLAVVHVDAANLPVAELGDSDRLQVGEWSIAVGNPLGLGSTTTVGVISALNRRNLQVEEGRDIDGAIQTDAAINRGNSGGALANINGQLVGINTAILSSGPGGGSIGLGFALPSNTVRRVVRDIISDGKSHAPPVRKPWLGVTLSTLSPGPLNRIPQDSGALVEAVVPDSPASTAGIMNDDIILKIDGKPIGDRRDVIEAIQQTHVGDKCAVHLFRTASVRELDLTVVISEMPASYQ